MHTLSLLAGFALGLLTSMLLTRRARPHAVDPITEHLEDAAPTAPDAIPDGRASGVYRTARVASGDLGVPYAYAFAQGVFTASRVMRDSAANASRITLDDFDKIVSELERVAKVMLEEQHADATPDELRGIESIERQDDDPYVYRHTTATR